MAVPAPEHRVADHSSADPCRIDFAADCGHGPAPFVPEAHRIGGVSVVQIGHFPGEEFHVGAAHSHAGDVHHDLAGLRDRRLHVLHRALAGGGEDEGPHPDHGVVGTPETPTSARSSARSDATMAANDLGARLCGSSTARITDRL